MPASLRGKRIVEPCLREHQDHDFIFDKPHLFGEVARDDRMIDPSFDDPSAHLEIVTDIPSYRSKSQLGEITYARLLHRREIAQRLERVRTAARVVVERQLSEEDVQAFAMVSTHPSLFRQFAAYWIRERDEGRLALWEEQDAGAASAPDATGSLADVEPKISSNAHK